MQKNYLKLRMKQKISETNIFLYFYEQVLTICNTKKSGIRGDKRPSYYVKVEEWSNLYAYQIGLGESYGHEF